ncbi:hypothetical protein TIFTF001_024794 [Ficus carica]|uniref:Ubiquitin-like protease family profile domain-containing protein n=1 Tax=Ficus carica TaxID=3494 RepID=A0AA88AQC1_FICCA|nr:hypothetical protein TIFTF001_024794 [Ficus carica]
MDQSRSMPCHSPLADESMLPQASHLVDDPRVLHKLKALEKKIEKMDREVKSQYSQLEKIVTECLDKMMNVIESLVPQQSTWAGNGSRGGDRVASEGVGFENGRDINVMASGNEDVGIEKDGGFENVRDGDVNIDNTELNVQVRDVRDSVDTEMNVLYYHSLISSNDCANEEDVSEVEQPERRPQRRLMKLKYRRTPYTTPSIKKIRYVRGSIQHFNPLRFEEVMKDSFDQYWKQNNEITSGLGCTRNWEFFRQILTSNIWLFTEHMEEATYGLRRRQHKYFDIINQNVVVLDVVFGQLLVSNSYDSDAIDDYLRKYISGEVPKMGKSWKGTKALYFPFNVGEKENLQNNHLLGGKHWVTVKVDFVKLKLVVFDCDIGCYSAHVIIFKIFRDCAVYAIKYIEFDMEGIELNLINDDMIEFY